MSGQELTPPGAAELTVAAPRQGMFGAHDDGDTSGYGGLTRPAIDLHDSPRPYGGYFDEVADALAAAMAAKGIPAEALEMTVVHAGQITFYVQPTHLLSVLWLLREDPALRFESMMSLSGVDYGPEVARRLHVVYEMLSMTYRRRIRLEVAVDVNEPYVPSATSAYPAANYHERETFDMFGVQFTGHPALTRILMPDDWDGHPQRKDYSLSGIPVEFKGALIPPPNERRDYS